MDNEQSKQMENDPSNPEKDSLPQPGNDVAPSAESAQPQKPGAILGARRIAAGISEEQDCFPAENVGTAGPFS